MNMKNIVCGLIFGCLVGVGNVQSLNSVYDVKQTIKPNDDIKTMFQHEQYQRIIDIYANTPRNLSSEELTLISQSYVYVDDLENAQKYIDLATKKNTKDAKAFYVKGIINNMTSQYEQAITALNQAIALSPKQAEYYAELGDVYFSKDNYTDALVNYRKAVNLPNPSEKALYMIGAVYAALDDMKSALDTFYVAKADIVKDKELYVTVLYNIGNLEYDNKNYQKAVEAYQELIEYFPDDYYSLEKMVQCYNALKYYTEAESPKGKLYEAYEKGLLASTSMSDMFCIDQFSVGNKGVSAYERFDNAPCRSYAKNIFYVTDSHGNIESIITLKYIPNENENEKGHSELILEKGSEQYSFNVLFEGEVRYNTLQSYIIDIVSGKTKGTLVKNS